jgi:hypothetical protein
MLIEAVFAAAKREAERQRHPSDGSHKSVNIEWHINIEAHKEQTSSNGIQGYSELPASNCC